VVIINAFESNATAGELIQFSVNNIFSPPGTLPNIQTLTIATYVDSN
jgi:hypothetical protein